MRWCVIAATIAGFAVNTAHAADVYLADYDADRKQGYVYIHGSIEIGDADRFLAISLGLRREHPGARVAVVSLISPGGRVLEASRIAGFIRGERAMTMVAGGNTCASACVVLLAAGASKLVAASANIEVHSAADQYGQETDASLAMTAQMARELSYLGVPSDVVGRVVTTRPNEPLYRLTPNDLMRMGVRMLPDE